MCSFIMIELRYLNGTKCIKYLYSHSMQISIYSKMLFMAIIMVTVSRFTGYDAFIAPTTLHLHLL